MSFWDESFFNYSVPDLNEEAPIEYSYDTIDLNAEPNADVGFDSQASYGFVYDDSKQSNPEEGYEEKPAASNVNWETKEIAPAPAEHWMFMPHTGLVIAQRFGVIVHLFSRGGPQTIFPLWTSANSLPRHNVVSVVYLGVQFINVTLQKYYPMPTVNPIWKRYRNDNASDWEFEYHDRLQEYERFIDENKLVDYIYV
ncbi:hypothetical protein R6Q57_024021 [Mikania cordata]